MAVVVLAENVAYLVDDQRRWRALAELRRVVGLAPEQILAAPGETLRGVVVGARPAERAERLRRCAEPAVAGASWREYPGIGQPGLDRIDLFTEAAARPSGPSGATAGTSASRRSTSRRPRWPGWP